MKKEEEKKKKLMQGEGEKTQGIRWGRRYGYITSR